MYEYLERCLGRTPAARLAPLIYTLMVLAIFYCIFEAQAEFNYLVL